MSEMGNGFESVDGTEHAFITGDISLSHAPPSLAYRIMRIDWT
jgi:hypothetical protein